MVLIDSEGRPVAFPFETKDFRGDPVVIVGGAPPHKPSSTGRVYTEDGGSFFPSVVGCKWVNECELNGV